MMNVRLKRPAGMGETNIKILKSLISNLEKYRHLRPNLTLSLFPTTRISEAASLNAEREDWIHAAMPTFRPVPVKHRFKADWDEVKVVLDKT